MRVLILGARGMLGHDLVGAFRGETVSAWDKADLDMTDEQAVSERVGHLEPELVVNAAAYTDVDRAEEDSEEADAVNGYAVGNLAVTCSALDIPLVHISTEMVFGQEEENGYAEDAEPETPVNAYGRSKLLGETLLQENAEKFWLVRTAWLFGTHGKNFLSKIEQVAAGKESIPVVSDVRGSPTSAYDLAAAIRTLMREKVAYGIYHLVNEGTASRAEVAETYLRLRGVSTAVERVRRDQFPTTAPRQRISILRNTKRPPLRSWPDALAHTVHALSPARAAH